MRVTAEALEKKRMLAPALLLGAAVLFAFAVSMPLPARPSVPVDCSPYARPTDPCMAPYVSALAAYGGAMWWRQTPFDLAEGLAIVAVLIIAIPHIKVPEGPRYRSRAVLLAGAASGAVFVLLAFVAHVGFWFAMDTGAAWLWPAVDALRGLTAGPVFLGAFAFAAFMISSACFALRLGLRTTIFRLAAPAVLVLMVSLSVLDLHEMSIHVTNFTAGLTAFGFDFVSNWTVLMVSAFLTVASPPRPEVLAEYVAPLPWPDRWWREGRERETIQECPKCHQPSWLPYQEKVAEESGQVYSYLVYPHPDESRRKLRKCVVRVPAAHKIATLGS